MRPFSRRYQFSNVAAFGGFSPSLRSDLVLWPRIAAGICFTDIGGTAVAAVGDVVRSFSDSKTGSLWTLASGTSPATLRLDADSRAYLECTGTTHYDAPSFSVNSRSFTWYLRLLTTNKSHQGVLASFGSNLLNWYLGLGQLQTFSTAGATRLFDYAVRLREYPDTLCLVGSASAITAESSTNSSSGSAYPSSTSFTTGTILGIGAGSRWQGRFYEGVLFGSADAADERSRVRQYFRDTPNYSRANRVVCLGDSRTWGYGPSSTASDWPTLLGTNLGATWDVINVGISGVTASGLVNPDSFFESSLTRKVCIVWCGVNSNWADYSTFRTFVQARVATGWQVIVCTDLFGIGKSSATRITYNSNIASNAAADGYTIADLAGISGLGADGDISGPNFLDQLHPNSSGHALIEPVIRARIV